MDDRIKQSQNTFIGANSTYPVVQTLPVDSPRLIPLTQGKFAIVDAEDYEYLMQWKWCATIDDCGNPRAQTNRRVLGTKGDVKYKNIAMSRIIMEPELVDSDNGMVVDHYNFDTLDNRRCNLRVCTIRENNQNRKSTDWE